MVGSVGYLAVMGGSEGGLTGSYMQCNNVCVAVEGMLKGINFPQHNALSKDTLFMCLLPHECHITAFATH